MTPPALDNACKLAIRARLPLENDTLLRALRREPTEYTPIWLMRQAGPLSARIQRDARARRQLHAPLHRIPSLATEVTLQPLARFPLDAAILFSDILTVPDAMGLGLHFVEGEGPRFERPLVDEAAIARLAAPDPGAPALRVRRGGIDQARAGRTACR